MEYKHLVAYFQEELIAESVSTRKCLERIPESVYEFKPHEKSMAMGPLTLLVAEIPRWITSMIADTVIDLATYPRFKLSNTDALVKQYDENVKGALESLKNATEEQLKDNFELKSNGQLLMAEPKLKSIGEAINHWVHHRGQLTVYMRLNDIKVPSVYGPSADEKGF